MPKTLEAHGQVERATNSRLAVFVDFDRVLMRRLDQLGCLTNLTRLDVLVDKQCYLEEHMPHLTNLIKLGLTVTSLRSITYVQIDKTKPPPPPLNYLLNPVFFLQHNRL